MKAVASQGPTLSGIQDASDTVATAGSALPKGGDDFSAARDFSIVMGYEAMRICIHGTTQKYQPCDVLRWMRLMLKQPRTSPNGR